MPDNTHDLTSFSGRTSFLHATFDTDAYLEACQRAADADPSAVNTAIQLADGLKFLGRHEERLARLRSIREAHPKSTMANVGLGLALLAEGRFREAWPFYQHRFSMKRTVQENSNLPPGGRWKGEPLSGKSIILVAEQGLGDTLQFARFGIDLWRAGNQVTIDAQPALRSLLQGSPAIGSVPSPGDAVKIHRWAYLLEIVPHFAPTANDLTWPGAYVSPPALSAPLRLPVRAGKDLRIGLAWYGNPANDADALRSASLSDLGVLADVTGATFFGLQPKRSTGESQDKEDTPWLVDISDQTFPFEALASCISSLDVVVTVCTSIAHLAGAMGKPVFILLSRSPDWRWGNTGSETPWYPSARLFRQKRLGDWSDPVAEVAEALNAL